MICEAPVKEDVGVFTTDIVVVGEGRGRSLVLGQGRVHRGDLID